MEIMTRDGRVKTLEELREEALDLLIDEIDALDTSDALEIGNEWRDDKGEELLYENDEYTLNDLLSGYDPYDILCMADSWSTYDDFVYISTWGDMECTDDVWTNIDTAELAEALLDEDFSPRCFPRVLRDVIDEYNSAKEEVENYNPYRNEGKNLLKKFTNCEADVTDLLQYIDRLVRNDEAWKEEE